MRKERRSRIGSYAVSSSMSTRDHRQQPCITCTTFNILAPIYKRLNMNNDQDQNSRESDYRAYWLVRNQRILDSLLRERSSIICLQVLLSLCPGLCLCLFMVSKIILFCLLIVSNWCRNFGWEMKSWLTCMRRDQVMQAISISSLHEPTTVVMVGTSLLSSFLILEFSLESLLFIHFKSDFSF